MKEKPYNKKVGSRVGHPLKTPPSAQGACQHSGSLRANAASASA